MRGIGKTRSSTSGRRLGPLLAKAGLPYRKYHATRHTFATWLLSEGADLRWVQQQMGHGSISQTADTYGHVQPHRHEGVIHSLDRHLSCGPRNAPRRPILASGARNPLVL